MAQERKSLCQQEDQRVRTYDPKVARIRTLDEPAGCTLTMIGRTCAITAGHCRPTLEIAEFNLPDREELSQATPVGAQEDIYPVDVDSLVFKNQGIGADLAVVRVGKNELTGLYPGDVQGYYQVSYDEIQVGDEVVIRGHGVASDPLLTFNQLGHSGEIVTVGNRRIDHRVDTTGGSSGSAILRESDMTIVGVHTHGGCFPMRQPVINAGGSEALHSFFMENFFFNFVNANAGTSIFDNEELKAAISNCLAFEEENL